MQTSLDSCVSEIGVPGATMTIERPDGAKWVGVSGFANLEMDFRAGMLDEDMKANLGFVRDLAGKA